MPTPIYLDHSASTPVDPRVLEAMLPYFSEDYGNPSSAHSHGRRAESAIEDARERIAAVLGARPSEIIFTSGGSESDNLALRGVLSPTRDQIITTPIEHSAVINTAQQLTHNDPARLHLLAVDRVGRVSLDDLRAHANPRTAVVSVIYANNEVGTVQDLRPLADAAHAVGAWFHTDAVQAAGQLPLQVDVLGVDMLSLAAHKFYGPKGVGALYVRAGVPLTPTQTGGSHEDGRRAGTLNTPLIVGMARALALAHAERADRVAHLCAMREQLIEAVCARVPSAVVTGDRTQRLPSHASFLFEGIDSSTLLMHLDMRGIAASGGSACKTGNPAPSGVLLALGYTPRQAMGTLRLTVGLGTTPQQVDAAADAVAACVAKLARLQPSGL
jgi:cysteine desulfurase